MSKKDVNDFKTEVKKRLTVNRASDIRKTFIVLTYS